MFFDRNFRILAVLTGLALAGPGLAGPADECSCDNLESAQQEYQNALYMEKFMLDAAAELKAWETKEAAEKAAGRSSVDIEDTSSAMLKAKVEGDVKLPFPKVKGYKGPDRVSMTVGTCEQPKAELDAMRDGSPCFGIAEATLVHEIEHQAICKQMGAKAYWDRPGSEKALEEAVRYKDQATAMKEQIGKIMDKAEVRLRGEWQHAFVGQGAEIVFFYTFDSGDMSAEQGSDGLLRFKGVGSSSNQILSMKADGVSCVSTGAVTQKMEAMLTSDGMVFGIDLVETNSGGDLELKCDGGYSFAMETGDAGAGQLATGLPLKVGDTPVMNSWAETIKALAASEGMQVVGDPTTSVTISCPKP